ncbi:hypothetical protein R3P38DRAFT_2535224 [Favolaschia claudopus]|uniref:Uncharacterized protein n=1 Tax=Favolaschia claudopus TaxID=2862362 RepID=A0AAW0B4M9_9AGAR
MARLAQGSKPKRQRARVPKENKKNLKLWAEGVRESILRPHIDGYQKAMDKGWRHERKYWKKVCREFHARVNWRTQDHEEPVLQDWNENSTIQDEELSPEEEVQRSARVDVLNRRMRRWFVYRARKLRKHQRTSGLDPLKDPFAILLAKLSGLTAPPKARQAYQQFMREAYADKIAPVVAEEWRKEVEARASSGVVGEEESTKEPKAGFRAAVARKVFAALSTAEREGYAARAKAEAAAAKEEYVKSLKSPPSQTPEARQRCINGLSEFMAPILRGINTATGLHATLIMGGPIPEFSGELRTIHLSYGQNRTVAADHWPQWDKARFADNVSQFMLEYLNTAFTPEDCAKYALGQPADLDAAQYTIDGRDSDSESDSDSDDSDSESDASAASDDDRPRKKRKISSKGGGKGGKTAGGVEGVSASKQKSARPRPRAVPKPTQGSSAPAASATGGDPPPQTQQVPTSTSSLPPSSSAAGSSPAVTVPATVLPPPQFASDGPAASQFASDMPPPPSAPPSPAASPRERSPASPKPSASGGPAEMFSAGNGWFLPEKERLQNVARNKLMFQQLKENFAPTEGPLREELRGLMKEARGGGRGGRRAAPASTGPARRSSRHAQHAQPAGMEVDSGGVDDSVERIGSNTDGSPHGAEGRGEGGGGGDAAGGSGTEGNDGASVGGAPPLSQAAQAAIGPQELMPPTSQLPPSTTFLPCPPLAPKWFCDAFALMTAEGLGCHYSALIAAWTRMEEASRFEQGPTRLPHRLRPQQVSTWITRGRRERPPNVDKPAEYAVIWQAWWDSMQPSWRTKEENGGWSVVKGYGQGGREWGPLYHWGVNGVLSIVASLFCWGVAVKGNADLRATWELAVNDVVWMLEGMATYYEMFKGKF